MRDRSRSCSSIIVCVIFERSASALEAASGRGNSPDTRKPTGSCLWYEMHVEVDRRSVASSRSRCQVDRFAMRPSERGRHFVVQSGDNFELAAECSPVWYRNRSSNAGLQWRIECRASVFAMAIGQKLDELLDARERQ